MAAAPRLNTMEAGTRVTCSYTRRGRAVRWQDTFCGFRVGEETFLTAAALFAAKGLTSFKEADAQRIEVRAIFNGGEDFAWDAYRYGGYWAVGTSADRLSLTAPETN